MLNELTLELFLNTFRHPAVVMNGDGHIILANPSFRELFSRELSLSRNIYSVLTDNLDLLENLKKISEEKGSYHLRDVSVVYDGHLEKSMDVETFPLLGREGEILAVMMLLRDRSEYIRFEEHQKRSDRVQYLASIAAGLAHEIKNPLSGIKGAAQMLEAELPNNKELIEFAQIIKKEVSRVDALVKDLLHFTKPRPLKKGRVNINQILHELILLQRTVSPEKVKFLEAFDPSLPEIKGDEDLLKQVFLNLIKNARQAISSRGQVLVSSRFVNDFGVVTEDKKNQLIRVDVEDDGSGISEGDLQKIFVPFFTTKVEGSGLGLPLCQQIIEQHKGHIEVASENKKGTRFSVYLPV